METLPHDTFFTIIRDLTSLDIKRLTLVNSVIHHDVRIYWKKKLEKKYQMKFNFVKFGCVESKISWGKLYEYSNNKSLNMLLFSAINENRLDWLEIFLASGIRYDVGIEKSAWNNKIEAMKLLLQYKISDPTSNGNYAIKWASCHGYAEIVKLLLKDGRANPVTENNYCLTWAARRGKIETVETLLTDDRVKKYKDRSEARKYAQERNYGHIIKLLE